MIVAQAVTAHQAIGVAKRNPTNATIVEAIERMHDELSEVKGDVATLKTDVATLKTDVGKLLHHFGLTSGTDALIGPHGEKRPADVIAQRCTRVP